MADNHINIIDCGIKDYKSMLDLQEQTLQNLLAGIEKETIFIVEHPPTITLGARDIANKLLKDTDIIEQAGIEIFKIRRGGGATAHNPGQIVIYPIINLKKQSLSVSDFVRLLEKIGIEFLAELGVNCQTKKGFPGLWIEDKNPCNPRNPRLKIASIGIQIKKWLTFHGIAININNALDIFDFIVPCGLDNIQMTNAQIELAKKVNINVAKNTLQETLKENFTTSHLYSKL